MSAEENKAIVDRFNVELNKGNLDAVDEFFAPDFIGHSTLSPERIPYARGTEAHTVGTIGGNRP